tara:strand:+ start:97274 stop:98023 length:750 start_codon:yes stop_codon:yes gene_type:complete
MRKSLFTAIAALCLFVLIAVWLPGPIERDTPRDLPWQLPDYRLADTGWEVLPDGRIRTYVEHFFLEDISPAMVMWFYQQLPIATVEYRGVTLPLYHIFHPSEHGTLRVLEPAPDGTPGMARGAMIQRDEWFGPYDSRGSAQIVEFSASGMLALPQVAGLPIGEIRHSLRSENGGTAYRVDALIGSDLPLLGAVVNYYLRTVVFHPAMIEQWQRHQLEEVASLQFFLPQLYAQRAKGTHFSLDTPSQSVR